MEHLVEFVLVALACIVTGSVLVVVRIHLVAWRNAPKERWLLPFHVWLVSVAHLCFVTGTGIAAVESLSTGQFTWRFLLYIVGSVCTVISLIAAAIHVRRRPIPR